MLKGVERPCGPGGRIPVSVDISDILAGWTFRHGAHAARLIRGDDGRWQLQLRLDMGVMQMDVDGRPDGLRPDGYPTWLDKMTARAEEAGDPAPTPSDWAELDREMMQYYHRRTGLMTVAARAQEDNRLSLAVKLFRRAVRDGNHNLRAMNFVARRGGDPGYVAGHERHRPFVLAQIAQAAGFANLLHGDPDRAIEMFKRGLARIRRAYRRQQAAALLPNDPGARQLRLLERRVRRDYGIDRTLYEQLDEAVMAEDFERAAILRDKIHRRQRRKTGK